ncbi:alpha/beta fold hydrolase [Pararhodobacter oceanensis]|uniref:alpha/beta hydrolase family protein n=1 Tax=Pararhodobacter oceanensis TaxID=2172121 RepID=UPI003A92A9A4
MSKDEYLQQDEATPVAEIPAQSVQIDADGVALAGMLVAVPAPKLAVVLHGATGVKAGFYLPFARWLAAEKQAAVLLYDYRDSGASGTPYRSPATMTDWGIHDATATRDWLTDAYQGLPLWVIGHSLGGMAMAFQPRTQGIARIISVAGGQGYVTDHPWPFQASVWALWYLLGPLTTWALGYLPGRRLGLGNDLPKGVFWQWRRWLVTRGSLPADPALGGLQDPGFTGKLALVALKDDVMIPPEAVWKMAAWHPHATPEQRLIDPADFGLKTVGHIHAFAPRNAALWPRLIAP